MPEQTLTVWLSETTPTRVSSAFTALLPKTEQQAKEGGTPNPRPYRVTITIEEPTHADVRP